MDGFGGINPAHAAAGFSGGLAYLPFAKPAGKLAVIGAVAAGVTMASYVTPVASEALVHFWKWQLSAAAERGLAFLIGLTAMLLIPIILGFFNWVKTHVASLARRVFNLPQPTNEETKQ